MSSNHDREPPKRSVVDERGNPFVTFKRFADEQMSSLLRGFANFPSHFFDLNNRPDRTQAFKDMEREWEQEAAELERRLNDFFLGLDKDSKPSSESKDTRALHAKDPADQAQRTVMECLESEMAKPLARDAERKQTQSHQEPAVRCPYRPAGDGTYHVRPFFFDDTSENNHVSAIEAHYPPLPLQYPDNRPSNPLGSSAEEQLAKDKSHDDFDCGTGFPEPDWWKKLLSDQSPWNQDPTPSSQLAKIEPPSAQEEAPRVISTVTTTERSTLPDGSVHTKVFFKKRFANGGEESTESIYTTSGAEGQGAVQEEVQQTTPQPSLPATNPSTSSAVGHDGQMKQRICDHIREKKKGGWFWS
ncbi:MAG: hypothetical protein LQ351_005397 [Letrouitia transgressa]|nr:MAG: hypothetical protein LQ351_005397 [Letrouitia transgressa]